MKGKVFESYFVLLSNHGFQPKRIARLGNQRQLWWIKYPVLSSELKLLNAIAFYAISLGNVDIRIADRYKLGRKIGSGSFGDIYLGK